MSIATLMTLPAQPTLVQRHPIAVYFACTYAMTWTLWAPLVVLGGDLPAALRLVLVLLGSLVPSSVGLWVTAKLRGRQGLRQMRHRVLMWRVGLRWYVAVFALPLIVPLGLGISILLGGDVPAVDTTVVGALLLFALSIFPGSALGEELGWRGLALPLLQRRHSALRSSLVIGVLWGLWHLPLYLTGADNRPLGLFPAFVVAVISTSVVLTWMFNGTGGSLLAVVLYHAAANLPLTLLLEPLGTTAAQPFLIYVALIVLVAAAVAVSTGPEHLSRTRSRLTSIA